MMGHPIATTRPTRPSLYKWRALPPAEWYPIVAGIAAAVITGAIWREAAHQGLASDFPADIAFTAHGLRTGTFPGDFLVQILNATFAGFSTDTSALYVSLYVVLATATGVKVWLSARFVVNEGAATSESVTQGLGLGVATAAAGLCTLAFCLPATNYYLGEVPPNVWHNPSTILLMPFAVGLFWASLLFLQRGASKYLWRSLLLGALCIAAKPSFILCFLPVFPVAAFMCYGWNQKLCQALLLALAIAGLLGLQYVYVYVVDPSGSTTTASSGVTIAPFAVWRSYTSDIPLAIVASYFFPAIAISLGKGIVFRSRAVQYALALARSVQ